jgi:hypothetical protein
MARAFLLCFACLPALAAQPSIRWATNESGAHVVDVVGLSDVTLAALRTNNWPLARWQQLFPVHASQGTLLSDIECPPMLGRYTVTKNSLRFEPRFPLEPLVEYRATFAPTRVPGGGGSISATRPAERESAPKPTVVTAVHPTASVLPENLLKFYLHFSAPMSRGQVYEHIQLLDEAGAAVELPFLELEQELWNPDQTRLTIILDPGRIKRGLRPLLESGPALSAGQRHTLVIDRNWHDSRGHSLQAPYKKTFFVTPPDRETPDPARWKVIPPARQTREPLVVEFDEPLDAALATRLISVRTDAGAMVSGKSALTNEDRRWEFVPDADWRAAPHTLQVPTLIEDLAGNNIGKPFDVELTAARTGTAHEPTVQDAVRLRFDVR